MPYGTHCLSMFLSHGKMGKNLSYISVVFQAEFFNCVRIITPVFITWHEIIHKCTYPQLPSTHTQTHTHMHTQKIHAHLYTHRDAVSDYNLVRLEQKQQTSPCHQAGTQGLCLPSAPLAAITQSMGVMSCKLNICKKAVINAISYLHDSP